MTTDFFSSTHLERKRPWQRRRLARLADRLFDLRIAGQRLRGRAEADRLPPRNVLVATVAVPGREADLQSVLSAMERSRHYVTVCVAPMGDRGKFDNINAGLQDYRVEDFDWLIVTDDDVSLPADFLDVFLFVAEAMELKIAQPAHRCHSYTTFTFNYRRWNSLGRVTRFVESGPLTAFHRDAFAHVLPFPPLRWAWGTDIAWSTAAARAGMAIGIVDCTPIEHLKPIASTYHSQAAADEARQFLASRGMAPTREELFVDTKVLRHV